MPGRTLDGQQQIRASHRARQWDWRVLPPRICRASHSKRSVPTSAVQIDQRTALTRQCPAPNRAPTRANTDAQRYATTWPKQRHSRASMRLQHQHVDCAKVRKVEKLGASLGGSLSDNGGRYWAGTSGYPHYVMCALSSERTLEATRAGLSTEHVGREPRPNLVPTPTEFGNR